VIIRILGEGQYAVDEAHSEELNGADAALESAVESGDAEPFRSALTALLTKVREVGDRLPDDTLEPSDAVVPGADATLDEVKELLVGSGEGFIPG
jgi:hypothetical protein